MQCAGGWKKEEETEPSIYIEVYLHEVRAALLKSLSYTGTPAGSLAGTFVPLRRMNASRLNLNMCVLFVFLLLLLLDFL